MPPAPPEAPAAPSSIGFAAFRHRDFRWMQSARLLSIVASEMQSVAVAWQVYQITHRAIDLGYVGLVQFLPGILLILLAGHTADHFDRRRVLLVCYLGYSTSSLLLFWQAYRHYNNVHLIFLILLFLGTVRAFSGPASQALLPQLVPAQDFPNAVAWSSSIFMTSTILGPAVGGLIYGITGGPSAVFAIAIPMYLGTLGSIFMIAKRSGGLEKRAASLETIFAGFRYVWRQKIILGSISLDLFAVLLGGAVALLPIYADQILHVGPFGLGILRASPAVGAAIMAVTLAHHPFRHHAGATMLLCVALFGASTIVFGLSRSFYLSLFMLLIAGASDMVSIIVRGTLVQIATPAEMRGRVSAVNLLFIGASNEFGQFESGLTAQWFGTVPAVIIGGVGTLIVTALWTYLFPALRQVQSLDLHED